ncbi:CDP-alcohol phosphatidyltransferase family protein [Chthonobacter albigriseus]|uniref:CDP-alcohol phosphatidyltransferase family protein n=1 Tax=Chthonobacter albigriseus TaxID=1683161 RepID=UPI0015EF3CA3|nr:CDP-alcohol phosphatidyltransferase family protein [Chthonobacter albigriseus]
MTVPNLITIARLIAVPAVVMLILEHSYGMAFAVFVAAGISDAVDGAIARHVKGQSSALGAYLDPIADKALLVSIYVTLAIIGYAPAWLAVLVVSRDVLIIGAVLLSWGISRPVSIKPIFVSKANTAFQIVFASVSLADLAFGWRLGLTPDLLAWTVAALTIASAAAYLIEWVRHMGEPGGAGPKMGEDG